MSMPSSYDAFGHNIFIDDTLHWNIYEARSWLEPYNYTISASNGVYFTLLIRNKIRAEAPLTTQGLQYLCEVAKNLNQDPYRELPKFRS